MDPKMTTVKLLSWFATAGGGLLAAALFVSDHPLKIAMLVAGLLFIVPWIFYLNVMAIWHWKERYRGKHSDLWGAILLIETSGWFKVVYWFRHILPDRRSRGRYSRPASP